MNDAYKEENPHPRVHLHFRPRYRNPVKILGETFVDEDFSRHYKKGTDRKVSLEVEDEIANKILENLQ